MAGRPGVLPWNMATFSGNEAVTTLSDNFNFLNNQINDSGAGFTSYAVDTGTANNLIVTLASAPVAYEAGMMVCTSPAFINTGASVINVNALGNIPIVTPGNIALTGGEINALSLLTLVYDGTSFRIIGPCALAYQNSAATGVLSANAAGYSTVFVGLTMTGFTTLTLNNLGSGIPIFIRAGNSTGGALNFKLLATNPATVAYTKITCTLISAGTENDMRITGIGIGGGLAQYFGGMSTPSGPSIYFLSL
jgi:hypothetical protein